MDIHKSVVFLLLFLILAGNATGTSYVYGNGTLLAKVNGSGVYYYHQDHLGSTAVLTDRDGAVVEEQVNLPFGEQISGGEKYGFTGKELDETDLQYFLARYYDPELGRFLRVDPVLQDFSSYAYAGGNPLRFIDPTGNSYMSYEERGLSDEDVEEVERRIREHTLRDKLGIAKGQEIEVLRHEVHAIALEGPYRIVLTGLLLISATLALKPALTSIEGVRVDIPYPGKTHPKEKSVEEKSRDGERVEPVRKTDPSQPPRKPGKEPDKSLIRRILDRLFGKKKPPEKPPREPLKPGDVDFKI